ncbi:MAG: hypothetical protein ACJ8A6_14870, partial [Gemmatimonadales bacterium]
MKSPGERKPPKLQPSEEPASAAQLLQQARAHERAGAMAEAVQRYSAAIETAEGAGERGVLAEALRRLGVVHHHRNEGEPARSLCQRSYETALAMGDSVLAAEALNALAGFDFEAGAIEQAREKFYRALELGGASAELRGRTEQNLGILANIQGALAEALAHYQRSLGAFESIADDRGCAIAYHNLGMVSADRARWHDAERYYALSRALAKQLGDQHLEGLCLLNHAEVLVARQRYEEGRAGAEQALEIFNRL